MKVTLSNRAKKDLRGIFSYMAENSPKLAIEANKKMFSMIERLEQFPNMGRIVPDIKDKLCREVFYKRYRIVYSVIEEKDEIYIHFVIDGRKNFIKFYKSYIDEFLNQILF